MKKVLFFTKNESLFYWLLVLWFFMPFSGAFAQNLILTLPQDTVQQGDTFDVRLVASNFDDMVSMQFSLNWNPEVIRFEDSNEMDLAYVAVGRSDSDNGNLRISWFDIEGTGETMPDGTNVVNLQYTAIGTAGTHTDLMITDMPLEIQVFQDTGVDSVFQAIELEAVNGSVTIEEAMTGTEVTVVADVTNVSCNGNEDGQIDLVLIGAGMYDFQWQGPNGFAANEPDISDLAGGDYILQILDEDGVVVLDTTFSITQPLQALTVSTQAVTAADCNTDNGTATLEAIGGTAPYTFDVGQGASTQNVLTNLAAGTYQATVTDANGCTTTTNFEMTSASAQALDLGEDISLCEGETAYIEAPIEGTYLWSDGSSEVGLSTNIAGLYSLTVTDAQNCTTADSIFITFANDVDLTLENEVLRVCPGDSLQLTVSGASEYTWTGASAATLSDVNSATPYAIPLESTTYNLVGTSDCGIDSLSVPVEVVEVTATAGQDTCVAPGTELRLNASGGTEYFWLDADYALSDYMSPNPVTIPEDSARYSIMIVDENGCTTFDEVLVLVGSQPSLFIKKINMLTPNGDGKNDVLYFGDLSKYGPNTLQIFNRWGDTVFDRVNYQAGEERFDGTIDGTPLPAGTYYYVLSFREETIKQTLTIVRE